MNKQQDKLKQISLSANRLITPVESEFLENLKSLFGLGTFGEIKNELLPLSLEIIKISLVGHTHPFETLRGLSDHQWEHLLENPHTPTLVNSLLDSLEKNDKLKQLLDTLRSPEIMQRLRTEWLYDMTAGRFDKTVPYLYKEDTLIKSWEEFSHSLKDVSFQPYDFCKEAARSALAQKSSGMSEQGKKLFELSFMAACRKLFVFFTGARETWVGSYTNESFKLSQQVIDLVSSRGQRVERLVLKFGLVDHVYYLKPLLEQLNRFRECVNQRDLVFDIQKKLCPFVSLAGTGLNFNLMADVFFKVYQPQRIQDLHAPAKAELDEDFVAMSGLPKSLAIQLGFLPLTPETANYFNSKIESLPKLRPFLHNPRTEHGLVRQRLYKGILDPMLTSVTQDALLALCRQWNPYIRTPEGTMMPLMTYVEANAKIAKEKDNAAIEPARKKSMLDDLLLILLQNTQGWQLAMEQDSFVIDVGRNYFMTILNKALEEYGSDDMKRMKYKDDTRVACVVVE